MKCLNKIVEALLLKNILKPVVVLGIFSLIALFPTTAKAENDQLAKHYIEVDSISFERPFWVAVDVQIENGQTTPLNSTIFTGSNWVLPDGFIVSQVNLPLPDTYDPTTNTASYSQSLTILYEISPPAAYEGYGFLDTIPYGFQQTLSWDVCNQTCSSKSISYNFELYLGAGLLEQQNKDIFYAARMNSLSPLHLPVDAYVEENSYTLSIMGEQAELGGHIVFIPTQADFTGGVAKLISYNADKFTLVGNNIENPDVEYVPQVLGILANFDGVHLTNGYRVIATNLKDEVITWGQPEPAADSDYSLLMIMGLAFIGGLILNLMPCVFPVLAMKAFNLASFSQKSARDMKHDGIAYTLGIITSFLIVASILILIRNMGIMVGWGFQLQSPFFVLLLVWLMVSVSLSFLGVYSFKLPALQALGNSKLIVGLFGGGKHATSFSTGVLATVVATPCTAPFMAPALGFALMQPALTSLSIFTMLGFGLAFPYLLISFVPAIGQKLPKSGPWMLKFQRWLSLPLALTAVWLIWVLAQQITQLALFISISSLAFLGFALYSKTRKAAVISILFGLVLVGYVGNSRMEQQRNISLPGLVDGLETIVWSPQAVAGYRSENRPIFLNVTASWCITCLVHEKLVFSNHSFQSYLKENNIVYMVADWTNPDARIAKLLSQHGRSGIPFYIYYPADQAKNIVLLPEVLTPSSTIKILEENQ